MSTPNPKKHRRGAVSQRESQLIAVWVPEEMFALLEKAVINLDTDRSKFVREAIREHTRRKMIA